MSDTEATDRWPFEKKGTEDRRAIQEFRVSVQSLLNEDDREKLEIASEVLTGMEDKMSKTWAIAVMKDIFGRFGLEFRRSWHDDAGTWRKSITEHSGRRISEDRRSTDDEPPEQEESGLDALPQTDLLPFVFPTLDVLVEDDEKEDDEDDSDAEDEDDNDDESEDYPDWRTPPLSPAASIEDRNCIPCGLRRFSSSSQKRPQSRSMPTPPISPSNVVTISAPLVLPPDKDQTFQRLLHDDVLASPRAFIRSLGKRIRGTSMKLRIIGRPPTLTVSSPGTPPPLPKRSPRRKLLVPPPTTINSDPQTIYGGPTLKLNRLSDVTLPLTQEERNEIARRRARESDLTEDFDLVVRLGTMRMTSRSSAAFTDGVDSLAEVPVGTNGASLPPIPLVDPEYLSKGPPATTETERIPPRRRISRQFSRLSSRSSLTEKGQDSSKAQVVRDVLSENNLRIHTARTASLRSRISDAIPSPPPSRSNFRFRDIPPPHRRSRSPSLAASSLRRKFSHGRRYPSMDYFPVAETTAVGLQGGKIGVVQMGSAYKANQILGAGVLIVPAHQERAARKRQQSLRVIETISSHIPRGSISKVEKLRGERLPVEPFQRWGMIRRTSIAKSMEQIMEAFEGVQKSVSQSDERKDSGEQEIKTSGRKSDEIKRASGENMRSSTELWRSGSSSHMGSTPENKSSMEYTLPSSVDGRKSSAKSSAEAKRAEMDQRDSANALRPKINGAVWII